MKSSRGIICTGKEGFWHEPSDAWNSITPSTTGVITGYRCVACSAIGNKIHNDFKRNTITKGSEPARFRLEQWSKACESINREPPKPRSRDEEILFQQNRMKDALASNDNKSYVDRVRTVRCRAVQDAFKLQHRAWWRSCYLTWKVDHAEFPADRCDAAHLPGCDWQNPDHNGLEHGILASPNVHEFLDCGVLIPIRDHVSGWPIYRFTIRSDYDSRGYARRYEGVWIEVPPLPTGYVWKP